MSRRLMVVGLAIAALLGSVGFVTGSEQDAPKIEPQSRWRHRYREAARIA